MADTALIVVDMQNAFIAPAAGTAVDGAERVVRAVNELVTSAASQGWPIYYTRDIGPTELPEGDPERQTEMHSDVDIRGTIIPKGPGKHGGFSGFVLATPDSAGPGAGGLSALAGLLRNDDVRHIVIAGLAADVCVAATARDARRLGYDVTIPLSATAFVHAHPDGDNAAIADLRAAGVTVNNKTH